VSNLIDGLHKEICRNKEVLAEYESIGPAGQFGAIMIRLDIKKGENALEGGDVLEMIRALTVLKKTK